MGGIDPQVNIRLRGTQLSACPALAGRYLSHRQDDAGLCSRASHRWAGCPV